jgi:hypothetical protein
MGFKQKEVTKVLFYLDQVSKNQRLNYSVEMLLDYLVMNENNKMNHTFISKDNFNGNKRCKFCLNSN